jgi:hypothetical protein
MKSPVRLVPAGDSLDQREENKLISEASSTSSEKVEISIMQGEFSDADDVSSPQC